MTVAFESVTGTVSVVVEAEDHQLETDGGVGLDGDGMVGDCVSLDGMDLGSVIAPLAALLGDETTDTVAEMRRRSNRAHCRRRSRGIVGFMFDDQIKRPLGYGELRGVGLDG